MTLELLKDNTVQEGQKILGDDTFTFAQNLEAKLNTPILEDETDLWHDTWLDSRTMQLYGGISEKHDNRYRFKIDHEFDLSRIVDEDINNQNSSISLSPEDYYESKATEFIIIDQKNIRGASSHYAIRESKYSAIRQQLDARELTEEEVEKASGFKLNPWLKPEEIIKIKDGIEIDNITSDDIEYVHEGWLELAAGKSNASEQEYLDAAKLLARYVSEAREQRCFRDGKGMGFYIKTEEDEFKMLPLCVYNSNIGSIVDDKNYFSYNGRFLRVVGSAKGDAKKIDYKATASAFKNPDFDPAQLADKLDPNSVEKMYAVLTSYGSISSKMV